MSKRLDRLRELQAFGGRRRTCGLEEEVVERFLADDPSLGLAIDEAYAAHHGLRGEWGDLLREDETDLIDELQDDLLNFYAADTVNPYVPLAARGPWVVTTHGAVIHDNGGYGMLGFGHAPAGVLKGMSAPHVMANVMTASFSHKRFTDLLRREIGQKRGHCPFDKFVCMNSGSEVMTIAMRVADIHSKRVTAPGGPKEGWTVKALSLSGSFHGRTDRPAQVSHSTLAKYREHLASFAGRDNLIVCPPNDVAALEKIFADAEKERVFIEVMLLEPVMGEGDPGEAVTRAFYDAARRLTRAHGAYLVVDSIQAGFRGSGFLSIVDYPGFEDAEVPDMESWSKALNAGQFPLSVLGMAERPAHQYVRGVYGNTMTANPRALEVGSRVLEEMTDETRANITSAGAKLVERLCELQREFPDVITRVQGTGLIVAAHIDPDKLAVVGADGLETWCRRHGLGVIHGGKNALRFTPHFNIGPAEIDLIVRVVRQGLRAVLSAQMTPEPVREVEVAR
ncbi:MAG: aminotransferase class III-fold pyridoxal phosphate-dependent enzyme [Myxococcota bacterium]